MARLMVKGHAPSIEDSDLREAVRLYNMLESGVRIDLADLTVKDLMLVNQFNAKIEKYKAEEVRNVG